MDGKKLLYWSLGLLGGGWLIYKLAQSTLELKAFYNQLQFNVVNPSLKLQKGNFWKQLSDPVLVLKLDVEFINPTKTSISFQKPTIKILYNKSILATSKISNDIIKIEAENTSIARNFTFEIPIYSNLSTITSMVSKVTGGISVDQSATATQKLSAVVSAISDNVMTKLLPLIDVDILVYVGETPIEYSTKLV